MKKNIHSLLVFILGIITHCNYAQNLVPNGDFEIYTSCPIANSQIYLASPWIDPVLLTNTSEYFNECSTSSSTVSIPNNFGGYQYAKNGKGYAGINAYFKPALFRSYIQTILLDTLMAGKTYCISFYVNCANNENYAIDAFSAFVSKTAITCSSSGCLLNYTPQVSNPAGNIITDTVNWTKISGSFVAVGGEKYITIGNFNTDATTNTTKINNFTNRDDAYYYIDDVSLSLIESANAGVNKNICFGDSVQIGDSSNSAGTYSWSPAAGLSNTTIAQPMALPKQTTVYTLTETTACDISTSSVTITVIDDCMSSVNPQIPNIFTPNNDGTNDVFAIICKNIKTLDCKIYNRWGILVNELTKPNEAWDGRTTAGLPCTEGVYYYILQATGEDKKEYNEKGFVQLVK